jgi:two-component system, chemotaxis family, chemotaxis protein CheY
MFGQNKPDRQPMKDANAGSDPSAKDPSSLLIIEDTLIHSTIIGRIADKVGFTVTTARSFEDACRALGAQQFDCITLDLGLGEHVGVDVLRHLSTIRCKARIIVISGSENDVCDETVRIGRALELNICESVPKPIDLKVLRETLAHIRMQSQLRKLATSPV